MAVAARARGRPTMGIVHHGRVARIVMAYQGRGGGGHRRREAEMEKATGRQDLGGRISPSVLRSNEQRSKLV
jgi:hypothetical protein